MLTLTNVSFGYNKRRQVINDFSLKLESGTVCGLLGKNGSGKTTLLYMICGLLKPTTGTIDFNGKTPFMRSTDFLNDIMIVPEEFDLPRVTLKEYAEINAPFYPRFDREHLDRMLALFELPIDINLNKCSMGQKKKAFLAFALSCNTSLLILDEPTNGLDISSKRTFRKAIAASMSDEKTILISTHQVHDVDTILDHVTIIDSNGVLLNAPMMEISEKIRFGFTNDRLAAEGSLLLLEVPGGYNFAKEADPESDETDVNIETLFELAESQPHTIVRLGLCHRS